MRYRFIAALSAAAAMALTAACGGSESALAETDENLSSVKAATMDLRFAATSGTGDSQTDPVGFELSGPFSFDDTNDLAVFDLTYTRLLGGDEKESTVLSTGNAAFVTVGGKTYQVDEGDLAAFKISDDDGGGLTDLGIADWVRNETTRPGKEVDGEATDVITGDVDAADMLSDLARIARDVGGETQLSTLDGAAAERLRKLVRASSIRIVTTQETRELRSLRAVIDFGTRAPEELRRTLGRYADARIEVTLSMADVPKNFRVEAPANAVDL